MSHRSSISSRKGSNNRGGNNSSGSSSYLLAPSLRGAEAGAATTRARDPLRRHQQQQQALQPMQRQQSHSQSQYLALGAMLLLIIPITKVPWQGRPLRLLVAKGAKGKLRKRLNSRQHQEGRCTSEYESH